MYHIIHIIHYKKCVHAHVFFGKTVYVHGFLAEHPCTVLT